MGRLLRLASAAMMIAAFSAITVNRADDEEAGRAREADASTTRKGLRAVDLEVAREHAAACSRPIAQVQEAW